MIPLFVYITDEFFLEYPNKELRLLIACCIADGFRIFAPACPYRNSEIITTVFEFFIEQLDGVENPAGPAFSRYFYLMENLSVVKTFGHCYDLETPDLVLTQLFAKMYKIVNEKHSLRIQSLMVDFLAPLISQAPPPSISRELMSAVLKPILRGPEVRPQGYKLASSLISLCSDALEKDLNFYVNEALIGHKSPPPDLIIYQKTFKVIHEVYKICPQLILGVFPYLEFKVKSLEEKDRMGSIRILADVFSEERSTLAKDFPELWEAFLGRFNDISVPIRVHCVKSMVRFFLHHDELRADLLETLKNIVLNDAEEEIRFEAVKAIIAVGQADLSVILETEDLQAFLEERTEDLKFKIRREALQGTLILFASFYS
jgi:sister-chromatid-cohesion protein PDS5